MKLRWELLGIFGACFAVLGIAMLVTAANDAAGFRRVPAMTGTAGEISGRKRAHGYNGRKEMVVPRDAQDFYVEPAWTIDLLLDVEPFPGVCWDPCAGSGTIPKQLKARGWKCLASDIVDRGYHPLTAQLDFTGIITGGWDVDHLLMNPPYRQADVFIRRAIDIAVWKVAALVQAKFLYSQRRHALFTKHPPAHVYHLSTRPSMPPGALLMAGEIEPTGGKTDYCWIVWDNRKPNGPTLTSWLKREAR